MFWTLMRLELGVRPIIIKRSRRNTMEWRNCFANPFFSDDKVNKHYASSMLIENQDLCKLGKSTLVLKQTETFSVCCQLILLLKQERSGSLFNDEREG
jgi:hypothetical protein